MCSVMVICLLAFFAKAKYLGGNGNNGAANYVDNLANKLTDQLANKLLKTWPLDARLPQPVHRFALLVLTSTFRIPLQFGSSLKPMSRLSLRRMGIVSSMMGGRGSNKHLSILNKASQTLYVSDSLEKWLRYSTLQYQGLLLTRPLLCKQWNVQPDIDEAFMSGRFGTQGDGVLKDVLNGEPQQLSSSLQDAALELLAEVKLPANISNQIQADICSIGLTVGKMCSFASRLQVKLEVLCDSVCSRWHQDYYVGRAIVTYNSHGTEYTDESNVDFWELENCGNNQCIIRDTSEIQRVAVGDVLFIKGKHFPGCKGLVHKSPEKRYHKDGRVINRLALKIDVPAQELTEDRGECISM